MAIKRYKDKEGNIIEAAQFVANNDDIPDSIDVPGHTVREGDWVRVCCVPAVLIEQEEFERDYTLVG